MDIHKNARSCPASRALLVRRVLEEGRSMKQAAEALGLSERRGYAWLARARAEGLSGLRDRRSRPRRIARRTPAHQVRRLVALRRRRWTGAAIALRLGLPRSTVARILQRQGLGRLGHVRPPEPPRRYEHAHPGELLHLDVKRFGKIEGVGHRITGDPSRRSRGVGYEYAHVCVDDASRLAYVEILADEKREAVSGFLQRAVRWLRSHGVKARRILTDNAKAYRSHLFSASCQQLDLRHSWTRPYRPQTNGKAERFIQTLQREWAYRFAFHSSSQRSALLPHYLHFYNHHRQHQALSGLPPISRLPGLNNLMGLHT